MEKISACISFGDWRQDDFVAATPSTNFVRRSIVIEVSLTSCKRVWIPGGEMWCFKGVNCSCVLSHVLPNLWSSFSKSELQICIRDQHNHLFNYSWRQSPLQLCWTTLSSKRYNFCATFTAPITLQFLISFKVSITSYISAISELHLQWGGGLFPPLPTLLQSRVFLLQEKESSLGAAVVLTSLIGAGISPTPLLKLLFGHYLPTAKFFSLVSSQRRFECLTCAVITWCSAHVSDHPRPCLPPLINGSGDIFTRAWTQSWIHRLQMAAYPIFKNNNFYSTHDFISQESSIVMLVVFVVHTCAWISIRDRIKSQSSYLSDKSWSRNHESFLLLQVECQPNISVQRYISI